MAVTQTQTLPAPFLEDITKQYAKGLGSLTAAPLDTSQFAPKVAGQDPLQTQAAALTSSGVGSYAPYITQAGAYDTAAAGLSGPSAYSAFMSPYQQSVIDTTLTEYDKQAAARQQAISDLATRTGNLGGGREGVMRSEYQTQSDLNRAMLQAQLQQQGFGQAQAAAAQAFGQQRQLGDVQRGMASLYPSLQRADISQLGQMGAQQQAYQQAVLDAQRETERLEAYEPYERYGYMGSGITGMLGGYPGQYQSQVTPNPTPLQSALGIGSTLAGIYGDVMGPYRKVTNQ
tara:strand:- start:52 stop:912 length:861 start_codon:yes stop_codon:yes gene_type:complete